MTIESMDADALLDKYKPLIYKTLHTMNIKKSHMDYEDYMQELSMQLLKTRKKFLASEKYTCEDEEDKQAMFIAYAGRGLYWHAINMLKKTQTQVFNCTEDEDMEWLSLTGTPCSSQIHENICLKDFFLQAKKRLSAEDYKLLLLLSDEQYIMREIAERMGVSVSVIHTRKERIQERLEGIRNCLKD